MKKHIHIDEIITICSGSNNGSAVYNNRGGEFCGIVSDNVFTSIEDIKLFIKDYLHDMGTPVKGDFQPVYDAQGKFTGFICEVR